MKKKQVQPNSLVVLSIFTMMTNTAEIPGELLFTQISAELLDSVMV